MTGGRKRVKLVTSSSTHRKEELEQQARQVYKFSKPVPSSKGAPARLSFLKVQWPPLAVPLAGGQMTIHMILQGTFFIHCIEKDYEHMGYAEYRKIY